MLKISIPSFCLGGEAFLVEAAMKFHHAKKTVRTCMTLNRSVIPIPNIHHGCRIIFISACEDVIRGTQETQKLGAKTYVARKPG